MISRDDVSKVKAAADLRRLILESGVSLRRRGNKYVGLCPFHKEKTPSFNVNTSTGTWKCFGCGACGDAISFVQERNGIDFRSAVLELASIFGVAVEDKDVSKWDWDHGSWTPATPPKPKALIPWPESSVSRFVGKMPKYLLNRDVTLDAAKAFELGFDREEKRAVFPVRTRKGVLVGCSGRGIGGQEPKYLHYRLDRKEGRAVARVPKWAWNSMSEEDIERRWYTWPRNRTLYGASQVANDVQPMSGWKDEDLYLVEGHVDVIKTWQRGLRAVATMGTSMVSEQVDMVVQMVPRRGRLVCVMDPDAAGQKALSSMKELVYGRVSVWVMKLPPLRAPVGRDLSDLTEEEVALCVRVDPGNATDEEFEQARQRARPML